MITVHHINCGVIEPAPEVLVPCHCLVLEEDGRLALVDAGFGLADVRQPNERLGPKFAQEMSFRLDEKRTAIRRLEAMGLDPARVGDIIVTHCDCDHVGGLPDFPAARAHLSAEGLDAAYPGSWRYKASQWAHNPAWELYTQGDDRWFGLEARPVELGFSEEVLLIPLFGHTLGHCGVAVQQGERWLLHVGDAYYLRVELETDDHPVSTMTAARAEDDAARRVSIEWLRRLAREHAGEVEMVSGHDIRELACEL